MKINIDRECILFTKFLPCIIRYGELFPAKSFPDFQGQSRKFPGQSAIFDQEVFMVRKADPWIEIISMRDEMDKIMNETKNLKMPSRCERRRFSLWQPVADLYETRTHLVIEMELPGVFQENISLEIHGNQIMVYGEKKLEKEASGSAYQMLERSYGPFSRVFVLPDHTESSFITAVFKNGILRVSIPRVSKPNKPVNIEITES